MVRSVKILDDNLFLVVCEYLALPLAVVPLRTGLATDRQTAGRTEEVSGHEREAGEADGGGVMVGPQGYRLLSIQGVLQSKRRDKLPEYQFPRLDISGGPDTPPLLSSPHYVRQARAVTSNMEPAVLLGTEARQEVRA